MMKTTLSRLGSSAVPAPSTASKNGMAVARTRTNTKPRPNAEDLSADFAKGAAQITTPKGGKNNQTKRTNVGRHRTPSP